VSWTNSQSSWTNFAGFTGKAIATNSATPDTTRLYLNLTVNSGFMMDVKSYSFYHRSSTTGYTNYQLLVNGVLVGSGSVFVSSGSTLQSTGTINVANAIAGLTGSVTVTLKLFGGSNGNNATFRLDDFTLNGYTQEVQVYTEGYRRGFNGMEKDDEVKGGGNSYDFGARIYDARVGRWLTIDPLARKYPDLNPYNFVSNSPLLFVDPNGEVIVIHYKENGVDKKYVYTPGVKPAISNEFVQQVHEAVSYVMKNDDEKVFQTISGDKSTVNIVESFTFDDNADKTDFSPFNYNTSTGKANESSISATISWNPLAMLITTSEGGLAPSTALLHEADHARGFLAIKTIAELNAWKDTHNPYDPSSPDAAFHKPEEKRVITGVERKYINKVNSKAHDKWEKFGSYDYSKNGVKVRATWWRTDHAQKQTVRNDHSGEVVKSNGVNSISRADGIRVDGQKFTEGRFIKKIIDKEK
jgi:RHS repeat-associated protein